MDHGDAAGQARPGRRPVPDTGEVSQRSWPECRFRVLRLSPGLGSALNRKPQLKPHQEALRGRTRP